MAVPAAPPMPALAVLLLSAALAAACLPLTAAHDDFFLPLHPRPPSPDPAGGCPLGLRPGTTLLFVADPGAFSGTSEAVWYLANMSPRRNVPDGAVACKQAAVGRIMGLDAAVIVTGIGATAASVCVFDVLRSCGALVKDAIFSGTSGWSAQLGGSLNVDGGGGSSGASCRDGEANANGQIVRIGDVAVTPFTVNWACRKASFQQTCGGSAAPGSPDATNECFVPYQAFGPDATFLFGECELFANVGAADLALADEIIAVSSSAARRVAAGAAAKAGGAAWPRRNDAVQRVDATFWAAMANGTGLSYPPTPQSAPPRLWSYREAAEIDSEYIKSGSPWDIVSRQAVAQTLSKGLGRNVSAQEVLAVCAMEGVGAALAIQRYEALTDTTTAPATTAAAVMTPTQKHGQAKQAPPPQRRRVVPFTNVRACSDFAVAPVSYAGGGVWLAQAEVENFSAGYQYAIATASFAVLSTLQARCERAAAATVNTPTGSSESGCKFVINYP